MAKGELLRHLRNTSSDSPLNFGPHIFFFQYTVVWKPCYQNHTSLHLSKMCQSQRTEQPLDKTNWYSKLWQKDFMTFTFVSLRPRFIVQNFQSYKKLASENRKANLSMCLRISKLLIQIINLCVSWESGMGEVK